MTTVAFNGDVLATDSRINCSGYHYGKVCKIRTGVRDGRTLIMAGAGGLFDLELVFAWILDGENQDNKPEVADDLNVLVIYGQHHYCEFNCRLVKIPATLPWFGGTGLILARAAMMVVNDPIIAATVAAKIDGNSGMPVHVVRPKYDGYDLVPEQTILELVDSELEMDLKYVNEMFSRNYQTRADREFKDA